MTVSETMTTVQQELAKRDITVVDGDIEHDGYYLPTMRLIVVRKGLSEFQRFQVLLHELAHVEKHHDLGHWYNLSYRNRVVTEEEANKVMVTELVNLYCDITLTDPQQVNVLDFLRNHQLDERYAPLVEQALLNYQRENQAGS